MRRLCIVVACAVALAAANCAPDATDQTASAQASSAPAPQATSKPAPCPTGPNLQEGVVRFFNEQKGFGYIVPAKGGPEVYLHHTALRTLTIKENDRVVFEATAGKNGPVAANIRVCGQALVPPP